MTNVRESNEERKAGMHAIQFCWFFRWSEQSQGDHGHDSRCNESEHGEPCPSDERSGDASSIYSYSRKKYLSACGPQTEKHREPLSAEAPYERDKQSPSLEHEKFLIEAGRHFGRRRSKSKPHRHAEIQH